MVTHTGREGRRPLFAYVNDAIAHTLYPIWLVPKRPVDADRLVRAILRRTYEDADRVWKTWRVMGIHPMVKPDELRSGATKEVAIQRKITCNQCGGGAPVWPKF